MNAESLSRWQVFVAAPHRIMFFAGAIQAVITIAWWLADLLGRYAGWYPAATWPAPPGWIHAALMIYGFFPFLIFGFLMTAMPSWLNRDKIAFRHYIPAWGGMAAGMAVFYAGLFAGRLTMVAGLALHLSGWAVGLFALARLVRFRTGQDIRHALVIVVAVALGWTGEFAFTKWLAGGPEFLVAYARHAGIWLFLLPVFFTVSHRMIPFFSSRVLPVASVARPYSALWLLLAGAAGHAVMEMAELPAYRWLCDVPAFTVSAYLSFSWPFLQSLKVRLLAVLHIAFAWLSIALALYAIQSFAIMSGAGAIFGLAPLHTLTIGYFAATVIGMAARVSLGHSGRPLEADNLTWYAFLGIIAVAVLRVAAEFPAVSGAGYSALIILAAVLWLACFFFWATRYGLMYFRPRIDGKPG